MSMHDDIKNVLVNIIRTRFSKSEMGSDFFLPSTTIILKTADGEGLLPSAERDNPP